MSETAAALDGVTTTTTTDGTTTTTTDGTTTTTTAPAVPAWMEGLPDEYRNDPDINRYQTVPDVLKGLKETRAWARGRAAIPAADDEAGWKELGEKLRGENPDAYEIPTVEGHGNPEVIERFKAFAHETGLPPRWARAVAEFNNRETSDALSKLKSGNEAELTALDLELGTEAYNRRLEAASNMIKAAGFEDFDAVVALQSAFSTGPDGKPVPGAGKAMKLLFALAEKTGELGKVDPTDVQLRMGTLSGEAAQAKIDAATPEFVAKAKIKDSPEYNQWQAWNHAVAAAAAAKAAGR